MKQYPTCFDMLSKTVCQDFVCQKDIRGLWQCIRAIPCCGTLSKMHSSQWCLDNIHTPWKFNIAPENGWLEDEFPFWDSLFSGAMLNFGGDFSGWWQLKHFLLFTPKFGEDDFQFDEHIFQRG